MRRTALLSAQSLIMSKSMERLYVSKKNETVRMFESDFVEFFSRVHPATPLLYLPVIGFMLYVALWQRKLSIVAVAGLFFLGILLWNPLQYFLHRDVFSFQTQRHFWKRIH